MSILYHTPIPLGAPADAVTFNGPLGELDSALYDFATGELAFGNVKFEIGQTLAISGGAITISKSVHGLNAGGSAATLDTINGGSDGDLLFLFPAFAGQTTTLEHGTGNIFLNGSVDIDLDTENKTILLFRHNSVWSDLSFGSVPATGTLVERTELALDSTMSIVLPSSTYTLAELYLELRSDYATGRYDDIRIRFNADSTAANYENQTVYANSAGAVSAEYTGAEQGLRFNRVATNSLSPSNYYSSLIIQIFNFRLASVYRMCLLDGATPGDNTGTDMYVNDGGGIWKNLADSITSIQVLPVNGATFKAGSAYMVKGY